ncbi:hypothetical protein [Sphaerisporangium perillae]|uniref:hypothetical protein n=1 Tax=Sphaerisporangium perillae TaxID=2935860 RepID=UPI00200F10CF|nr:hypothetical protein [Sphaerisporangium perillae]
MRSLGVWGLVLALACGCAAEPGFEETAGLLKQDGDVLGRLGLAGKNIAVTDDRSGCAEGTRRGLYTITGDFPQGADPAQAAAAFTSTLAMELHTMGYQDSEGPHAQFGVNVSVLRKESLGIVFTVTVRDRRPNVEISGSTGCLAG